MEGTFKPSKFSGIKDQIVGEVRMEVGKITHNERLRHSGEAQKLQGKDEYGAAKYHYGEGGGFGPGGAGGEAQQKLSPLLHAVQGHDPIGITGKHHTSSDTTEGKQDAHNTQNLEEEAAEY
eukprot:TRINITY_DN20542_c0_g1_i1.p1 TRINITY_DN20542_c0_g1~~TRINITY_DN20542_c0_g1_i1.p1  ORF type:complete len:121 (+),score=33.41 TRINITY_DN20542_c0_g1_i1:120-482(+)